MRRAALALLALLAGPAAGQEWAGPFVPLEELEPPEVRAEVAGVTGEPTVRTAVRREVRATRAIYGYLLERLPLAADALRALEEADYAIEPEGDGFTIDDRAGATAACDYLLVREGHVVVIARGALDVAVLPDVEGTGVIAVRFAPDADDPPALAVECRVAFRVASRLLHAVSRPFRRTLRRVLAGKLTLLVDAATTLAELVQADPWRVYAALGRSGATEEDLAEYRRRFLLH